MAHESADTCCGCHTPVPSGARYCAQCGTPVPRAGGAGSAGAPSTPAAPTAPSLPLTQLRIDPPSASTPVPSTLVDGKYLVLERLGGGGFGEVFRVRDTLLGREFALKSLHAHLSANPDVRERFIREARVLMDLQHPNLVPTRHLGEWRGMIYLVMDLSPGRPLSSVLHDRGRLPGRTAAAVAIEVLEALEYAHGMGVLHRDLKPSNLLVRPNDAGRWEVRLLDFGVAKVLADSKLGEGDWRTLATGGPVGTWHYMSPEQIGFASPDRADAPIDARSDVYSLGVVLYEMIAGRVPFSSDQVLKLIREVQQEPPPSFRSLGVDEEVPGLEALVMRALAKRADDRPASAGAMLEELRALVGGPATVVPPRTSTRAGTPVPTRGITPSTAPALDPRPPRPSTTGAGAPATDAVTGGTRGSGTATPSTAGAARSGSPGAASAGLATAVPTAGAATAVSGAGAAATSAPPLPPAPPAPPPPPGRGRGLRILLVLTVLAAGLAAIVLSGRSSYRFSAPSSPPEAGRVEVSPALARYAKGAALELRPNPHEGWMFVDWSDGATDNPRRWIVEADGASITARFRPRRFALLLRAVPPEGGTVGPLAERTEHEAGVSLDLGAEAASGWRLVGWSDGATAASRSFEMPARDAELSATFTRAGGARALAAKPPEGGSASIYPTDGVDTPGAAADWVARPAPGWRFTGWSDGDASNPRALPIPPAGTEPAACFDRLRHALDFRAEPEAGGTVTADPAPDAAGGVAQGDAVTLSAAPARGWRFRGWSDGEGAETRRWVADAPAEFAARFAPVLEGVAVPPEGGQVVLTPAQYDAGGEVTLVAGPRRGWRFAGWTDGETGAVRTVVASEPGRFEARFQEFHALELTAVPDEGGTVTPGSGEFVQGGTLVLRAAAHEGWRFAGWSDGEAEATRALTVDGPARLEARFVPVAATPGGTRATPGDTETGGSAPAGLKRITTPGGGTEFLHEPTGIVFVLVPGDPPFLLGKTEVTNAQYRRLNPSHRSGEYRGQSLDGDDQPVSSVSWHEAEAFCKAGGFRLPTVAEWERAARCGEAAWPPGPDSGNYADLQFAELVGRHKRDDIRNHDDGHAVAAPVGSFPAPGGPGDAVGLKDLVGNVWEWCADPVGDQYRAIRGGGWADNLSTLARREKFAGSFPPQAESERRNPRERGGDDDDRERRQRIGFRAARDP